MAGLCNSLTTEEEIVSIDRLGTGRECTVEKHELLRSLPSS